MLAQDLLIGSYSRTPLTDLTTPLTTLLVQRCFSLPCGTSPAMGTGRRVLRLARVLLLALPGALAAQCLEEVLKMGWFHGFSSILLGLGPEEVEVSLTAAKQL